MRCKNEKADAKDMISFVEDMIRYLENKEIEECKTNQNLIGMQELFRGCIVKAWKGVNFSTLKCKEVRK